MTNTTTAEVDTALMVTDNYYAFFWRGRLHLAKCGVCHATVAKVVYNEERFLRDSVVSGSVEWYLIDGRCAHCTFARNRIE